MKAFLVYAVLAVVTTALAAVLFHTFRDVSVGEDSLTTGTDKGVSRDEVRAVVDEVFEDHVAKRLGRDDSRAGIVAGRIDAAIAEVMRGQTELMKRLDAVANAEAAPAALADADYVIPESARIEEIVAQSIAREEERSRRERRERMEQDMAKRAETMRERTVEQISKSLELRADQRGALDKVIADNDVKRRELFTQMRETRGEGVEGGWRGITSTFEKMNDEAEGQLVSVLDSHQQDLWNDYKKENPMALSGMGGMRFGRGGRGRGDGEGDE